MYQCKRGNMKVTYSELGAGVLKCAANDEDSTNAVSDGKMEDEVVARLVAQVEAGGDHCHDTRVAHYTQHAHTHVHPLHYATQYQHKLRQ